MIGVVVHRPAGVRQVVEQRLVVPRGRVQGHQAPRGDESTPMDLAFLRFPVGDPHREARLVPTAKVHAPDRVDHALAHAGANESRFAHPVPLVVSKRLEYRHTTFRAEVLEIERLTEDREWLQSPRLRPHHALVALERAAGFPFTPAHLRSAHRFPHLVGPSDVHVPCQWMETAQQQADRL